MNLALLLALQAGAAATPASPGAFDLDGLLRRELDLFNLPAHRTCAAQSTPDATAITVCARPQSAYPMARMDRIYGPPPPLVAEVGVTGALRANVHVESVEMPPGSGQFSNRAMLTFRLPF